MYLECTSADQWRGDKGGHTRFLKPVACFSIYSKPMRSHNLGQRLLSWEFGLNLCVENSKNIFRPLMNLDMEGFSFLFLLVKLSQCSLQTPTYLEYLCNRNTYVIHDTFTLSVNILCSNNELC